ncbi:Mitogen-activated protein kinase [Coelomomyces lativittatus]|nr:Mitogen-activated protein kinase [Coelomomyces lativittatus]KAJ1506611.1 Mitogen-activated protein kinase [Coelomomyces lativittatus]KAJ1507529.1 Mitogen-activated protein kinase [Coelomomyces lativittatus]
MPSAKTTAPIPSAILKKYKIVRELGAGAYGVVSSAKKIDTDEDVAIKRVTKVFDKTILAKRALREIKLLRHFNGHDNITSILDMEVVNIDDFNEIFLVQELMEADLHQIIRSEQPLSDAHHQYFIYQILRGLKYIHSANVLHRDLKPGNLLVNADCELKICDFGLARGYTDGSDKDAGFMTEYVATRWYRAPEIMLSFQSYTKAIDVWSVGCIFGELLGGKPVFRGRDYVDQLNQILAVLGTPDEVTLKRIGSQRAQIYIRSLSKMPKIPWTQLFPKATALALDLVDQMLQLDPAKRISVEDALRHPYLATYHDVDEEPGHTSFFDFSFESAKTLPEIKAYLVQEIQSWKASKSVELNGSKLKPKEVLPSPDIKQAKSIPKAEESVEAIPDTKEIMDSELERELAGGICPS